jgi:hypothetical protein
MGGKAPKTLQKNIINKNIIKGGITPNPKHAKLNPRPLIQKNTFLKLVDSNDKNLKPQHATSLP